MVSLEWQPKEIGISEHPADGVSPGSEHLNKKIAVEMFDGITREVVEEIGVPAHYLVKSTHILTFLNPFPCQNNPIKKYYYGIGLKIPCLRG